MTTFLRFCVLLLLVLPPASAAQDKPRRIVSLSLCTDELVLRLADRGNIASVSYLAADPTYSAVTDLARGLPLNSARAEEIIALRPDLILSSRFSASATISLLRRLGHEVTVLDFPQTLEQTYAQIRAVAAQLGEAPRAEALVRRMQSRVAAGRAELARPDGAPLALFYTSNGFSYGSGTLRDYFLRSLGWRNLAAESGLGGPAPLNLERVVAARPDYLLVDRVAEPALLAHPMLRHPALRRSVGRVVELPDRLFQCAGPSLTQAYTRLARQLDPAVTE